jgi:type IV secretory pathway TraG/TraD family ATPase VirD4
MSMLADRANTLATFEGAERQLYGNVIGGAILVVGVLIAPKDIGWDMGRFILTVIFFLGLMTVVWSASEPLEVYLRARLELSLEDFGNESRSLGHTAIDALARYLRRLVWPLVIALGLLFIRVLAAWPIGAPIASDAIMWPVHLAFWAALAAVPVQLLLSTNQITETVSLWRSFHNHLNRSKFRPRTRQEIRARIDEFDGPPVLVSGPYTFRAGGAEWSWSDFQKNAIVFGQTGSGKTVTVLNALLDGLLSSAGGKSGTEPAAALILDPKGDYRDKIGVLCNRLGRSGDLCIFDPNDPARPVRWNPFDGPDDALEISERFAGVLQLLGMKNTQESFWIDSAKTFIRHAVGILRATEPPGSPPSFIGVNELATRPLLLEARLFILYAKALSKAVKEPGLHPADLAGDIDIAAVLADMPSGTAGAAAIRAFFRGWALKHESDRKIIGAEVAELAERLEATAPTLLESGSEALLAAEYLAHSWLPMPDKTRGSIQAHLTTMIDPFLVEPYRTVFSGQSTIRLADVLDQGQIFYVFMPRDDRSAMSRVVNTLIKLEFYRQVLLRRGKTRPSLFFCDEFQSFFTSDDGRGDGPFFERSRESFHANLVATQNLSSLLRDVEKEETIHSFMGNCAVKVFLRNTEGKTNEYASKQVFGEYLGFVTTAGRSIGDQRGHHGLREGASISVSAQTLPVVAAERLTQLVIPDREAGVTYSEALIHLGSRASVIIDRLRFKVHPLQA